MLTLFPVLIRTPGNIEESKRTCERPFISFGTFYSYLFPLVGGPLLNLSHHSLHSNIKIHFPIFISI